MKMIMNKQQVTPKQFHTPLLLLISIFIIVVVVLMSRVESALVNPQLYPSSNTVATSDGFTMYWRLLTGNDTNHIIEIAMIGKGCASGWVGLGIDHDTSGGMANADTIMSRYVNCELH